MTPSAPERPSPLANRITPWGEEVATPARGGWTGNRGVIHRDWKIVKRSATDGWVCCALHFRGWRRKVMTPGRWTELFFLDEATAFAAGHRPCFFCRREAATAFARAWGEGAGLGRAAKASEMDAVMKTERAHVGRRREAERWALMEQLPVVSSGDLTRGAMVMAEEGAANAYLFDGDRFRRWTVEGYVAGAPKGVIRLLTPASVMRAFAAGYKPEIAGLRCHRRT